MTVGAFGFTEPFGTSKYDDRAFSVSSAHFFLLGEFIGSIKIPALSTKSVAEILLVEVIGFEIKNSKTWLPRYIRS